MKTKSGKRKAESGSPPLTAHSSRLKAPPARVPLLACKQCPPPSLESRPAQKRKAESRKRTPALAHCSKLKAPSPFTLHSSPFPRSGFTLTEMLIVISIIGMLAAISLGALYSARESARIAKTKSTIAKLDRIIQARYEEFFTRRMPIRSNSRIPADAMAELKLRTLYETIRMEMPDRFSDITFPRSTSNTSTDTLAMVADDLDAAVHPFACFAINNGTARMWVDTQNNRSVTQPAPTDPAPVRRTALARRYWRQLYSGSPTLQYDTAECLFMVVNADPEAREQFQETEIGDADEDGFFEFHDAWGRPIRFIRWAPGFAGESDLMSAIDDDGDPTTRPVGDPAGDPDPINPRRIGDLVEDPPGHWYRETNQAMFRLVPLIYSAGPDGVNGIIPGINGWRAQMVPGDSVSKVWIVGWTIGKPVETTDDASLKDEIGKHVDNIHNHSLGMN